MLRIVPLDDAFVRIDCDDAITHELAEYFQFDVPGARFMQQKYGRHWSGKIRLFKLRDRKLYRGLITRLKEFADARGYPVDDATQGVTKPLGAATVDAWLASLALPFAPRSYQYEALLSALRDARCVILSPTGSGKSFIIYLLQQFLAVKTLVIVPTIGLVAQMTKDFRDYGCTEPIHNIQAGSDKQPVARLTVSTWQSIYQLPASYFAQFPCVIVDEVHTAKSKSLTGLMEKCTRTPYRFGFTGTLDQTECHRLVLEGLFGAVTRVATTAELVKAQQLAPLRVKMCVLEYTEPVRKQLRGAAYVDELDFLVQEGTRNEFIARLAGETRGNTLVLFQYVEKHGLALFKRIQALAKASGKQVHYIAGSVSAEDREAVRKAVDSGDNHVLVASYGTTQLGINIPNLRNLIFGHPAKSPIRVLQSIGRVLRLSAGKTNATLFDIVDDLRIGKHENHCFRHAQARMQYYSTEKFPASMQKIDLTAFAQVLSSGSLF